ncbi:MAG: hypothetical protein QGH39_05970 [Candidatus Thermoplasmatota archaeon]|jgi:hypothetical protein|nr:hypothetical protein [Candidatus Thermoplasmatota archaeon]MDP7265090.1 hypothetical protein [Candidatus Thermoplasmatota archaeon]
MCNVPILLPVNYGAGMTDEMITHDTTLEMVDRMRGDLFNGLGGILEVIPARRSCPCTRSVSRM